MGFEGFAIFLAGERDDRRISRFTDDRAQQSDEFYDEDSGSNGSVWHLELPGEGVDWRDGPIGERQSRYRRLRIYDNSV